jgi:hypothetical protein
LGAFLWSFDGSSCGSVEILRFTPSPNRPKEHIAFIVG